MAPKMLRSALQAVLFLSLFCLTEAVSSPNASPSSTSSSVSLTASALTVGLYSYYGCQTEATSMRALASKSTAYDTMTLESCAADCAGYTFFGTEYGRECYCGNMFSAGSVPAQASDCSFPCAGNALEVCGAGNRLSVFELTSDFTGSSSSSLSTTSSSSTSSGPAIGLYTFEGCFTEATNERALSGAAFYDYTTMTLEECATDCAGWNYFGVEYGGECYCGTSPNAGSVVTTLSDCYFACPGNSAELCGAGNRLQMYILSSLVVSSSVSSVASTTSLASSSSVQSISSVASTLSSSGSVTLSSTSLSKSSTSTSQPVSTLSTSTSHISSSTSQTTSASHTSTSTSHTSTSSSHTSTSTSHSSSSTSHSSTSTSHTTSTSHSSTSTSHSSTSSTSHLSTSASSSSHTSSSSSQSFQTSTSSSLLPSTLSTSTLSVSSSSTSILSSVSSTQSPQTTLATSTTSAQSTPTLGIVQTIGAYTFQGCYTEATTERALSGASFFDYPAMTLEECANDCAAYKYFGVEYGGECYCGNSLNAGSVPDVLTSCNFLCPGNSFEYCGAGGHLEMYMNANWTASTTGGTVGTTPAQPSSSTPIPPHTINGWAYRGCFADVPDKRTMTYEEANNGAQTIESCISDCGAQNYAIAGLEFGQQCFCSQELQNGVTDQGVSSCNTECAGNASEMCGGPNFISVYSPEVPVVLPLAVPQATGLPASWSYQGCIEDNINQQRTLPEQLNLDVNDAVNCILGCEALNYTAAGLEYADQCFCGTIADVVASGPVPSLEKECSAVCSGNSLYLCGASALLTYYTSNSTSF